MIATAGRDPHVRVYDRRKASEENNQPLKKFCPHHLVGSTVLSCFSVWICKIGPIYSFNYYFMLTIWFIDE